MTWRTSHTGPRKSRSPKTSLPRPDLAACRRIESELIAKDMLIDDPATVPIFSTFLAPSGKFYGKAEEDHVDAAAMIEQRPVTLQDLGFVRAFRNNVGDIFGIEFKTIPTKAQMKSLETYFAAFPKYHIQAWSMFFPGLGSSPDVGWKSYDSFDDFKSYLANIGA